MINILKEIGIILRTNRKESNPLFLKELQHPVLQLYCPFDNGDTITNPYDIANTFNSYFVSMAGTTERT